MQYYNPKDIARLTGFSRNKCYQIINDLNEELKREYPNQYILCAKIPIWYWEEKMLGKRKEHNQDEKEA